jgi:hypothetical protein
MLKKDSATCAEDHFLVLDQPVFEHGISYLESLHDLVRFWNSIAMRIPIQCGSRVVSIFENTLQILSTLPNWNRVDISVDEIPTEVIRDMFTTAKQCIADASETHIKQSILSLGISYLKALKRPQLVETLQEHAVSIFHNIANELQAFICEDFH